MLLSNTICFVRLWYLLYHLYLNYFLSATLYRFFDTLTRYLHICARIAKQLVERECARQTFSQIRHVQLFSALVYQQSEFKFKTWCRRKHMKP